jgi:hypothetical protein
LFIGLAIQPIANAQIEKEFDIIQEPSTKNPLIIGRIKNLIIYDDFAIFEAIKTRVITFNPFSFITYTSAVMLITYSKLGILTHNFIFGFFYVEIYIP